MRQLQALHADCPALLPVDAQASIVSPECVGCLTCVSRCPAPGALDAALPAAGSCPPCLFAAAVVAVFFGILLAARLAGHWHSGVSGADTCASPRRCSASRTRRGPGHSSRRVTLLASHDGPRG